MRQWVADFTGEDETPRYLVRHSNWDDSAVRGYVVMDLAGVLDAMGDIAYGDGIGEPYDVLRFWVLMPEGPERARVDQFPHAQLGKVEARIMRQPAGKRSWVLVETGYRDMVEV